MRTHERQAMRHPSNAAGVLAPLRRFGLIWLLTRFPQRLVWAGFALSMGFVSIAILATVAMISRTPFIFPSLGPTAILFFFHPMSPSASPGTRVGLLGMREWAKGLGGTLEIKSDGKGTTVLARLPLPKTTVR